MSDERTKPSDVAMAEHRTMTIARRTCANMMDAALHERRVLLAEGFPVAHALCKALDDTAQVWAAQAELQRRAIFEHARKNLIQL